MNCLACFKSRQKSGKESPAPQTGNKERAAPQKGEIESPADASWTKAFTFRELATATKNFRQECLLGEGGSGRVYKGTLGPTGQVVAVKQLDRNGLHKMADFHSHVASLSNLRHENLVSLVGYCADGDQRILVYEFMPRGSLQDHILGIRDPLDWFTRMNIAYGAAKGLEYLHQIANPPIIYRDFKPSNVLLDHNFTPKLSDYAAALHPQSGDRCSMSSTMMGTYGYVAPEYQTTGHFTVNSDVYSFGVVFLEIITGKKTIDTTRPVDQQNLVAWAQPMFKDPKRFPELADPLLQRRFPDKDLNQAVAIAAMCLQEEPAARPFIGDIVTALSFLSVRKEIANPNTSIGTPEPLTNDHEEPESENLSDSRYESSECSENGEDVRPKEARKGIEGEEECDYASSYSKRHAGSRDAVMSISRSSKWSFESENKEESEDGRENNGELPNPSSRDNKCTKSQGHEIPSRQKQSGSESWRDGMRADILVPDSPFLVT